MGIEVIIVSHKRAGRVSTHRLVDPARVCVPERQFAEYARFHPPKTLLAHPDSVVGLPAKRQWIYKTIGDVMMLDDDSVGFHRIYRASVVRRPAILSPRRAYEVIQSVGETARQLGAFLFGFGPHAHVLTFHQHRPFRFGGYSPGGAIGLLKGSRLWFPTDVTLPIDDYWICLLNAFYHRFAWYDQRFAWGFKETYRGAGGMAEFRNATAEKDATAWLVKHFGSLVRPKKLRGGRDVTQPTTRRWNEFARQIEMPYRI